CGPGGSPFRMTGSPLASAQTRSCGDEVRRCSCTWPQSDTASGIVWHRQATSLLRERLCGVRASPQRSGIDAVRVQLQHPIVELARGCRLVVQAVEILNVLSGRVDMSRLVIRIEGTVAHDDGPRLERLDLVERCKPGAPARAIGLHEKRMRFV